MEAGLGALNVPYECKCLINELETKRMCKIMQLGLLVELNG